MAKKKEKEEQFFKDGDQAEIFCGGGCADDSAINSEKFEKGATAEESIQTPYFGASEVCNTLDTVVPNSMAIEQKRFNQRFKSAVAELKMTVEEWVAKKLHYKSVEELCYDGDKTDASGRRLTRFSQEQIDAIGTAIWNYENNGDAIIIADQTGVGKGRQAAGILRYAILELKVVPFFFTEKQHLINDIYRDLVSIGFDAGIPYQFKKTEIIESKDFTDKEILDIIIDDIKEKGDVIVEYIFPEDFSLDWLYKGSNKEELEEKIEAVKAELIELYRQKFIEEGYEKETYVDNPNYEREIADAMRKGKYQLRPFIPNDNFSGVKDIDGNLLYPKIEKEEKMKIYKFKKDGKKFVEDKDIKPIQLELPSKYKLFCLTYSQVSTAYNKDGSLKAKIKLLQRYIHDSVLVMDESHNAGGVNAQGKFSNAGEFLFAFAKSAKMVTYLSATYAKRPDNMPLYALRTSIRESGLSDREMIRAFQEGGNSLQEAVSAELTRNGQLLRREKQIQGKSDYYYESENTDTGKNQISKLDRIAKLFAKVQEFESGIHATVREYARKHGTENEGEKIKKARGIKALSFQLFNFMLLGLKVRQTTEFAIEKLRNGRKTIITVANTMESALDNMSKTFMSNVNKDAYKVGDKIKNDFALYMAYLLNYTMRYQLVKEIVGEDGEVSEVAEVIYVLDSDDDLSLKIKEDFFTRYKSLLEEILEAETGIPIAPLDMIKKNIKDAGFSIGEITGRSRQITFGKDTSEGTIESREIRKTDIVVREFNENELDCLLINQSGATGISMHAYPNKKVNIVHDFPKDKDGNQLRDAEGNLVENAPKTLQNKKEVKKRAMVITQMELDINKEVQKLGRINRTGQVYSPEYTYVVSAIPSEARLTALMEKKLRSLSANVSSNQEQASYLFSSDDFFSDVAVSPFNETMQDIGMRGVTITHKSDIEQFTKSLYFNEYNIQRDFYDTFSKRLQEEIERLKSQGLYTGSMAHKDYLAETLATFPFFIGDNNAKTSFGRHSFIEKVNVQQYKEKYTDKKIAQHITDYLRIKQNPPSSQIGGLQSEDLYFTKISEYQLRAIETLEGYEASRLQLNVKLIKDIEEEKKEANKVIEEKQAELAKLGKLQTALDLEAELRKTELEMRDVKLQISDKMESGDFDAMQKLTPKLAELTELKKSIETKLVPFAEVLKQKDAHRGTIRAIESQKDAIERMDRQIAGYEKNTKDFQALIAKTKDYVSKIGSIMQLSVNEEKEEYKENGWEVDKYVYTPKFTQQVVLVGVTFPYGHSSMIPSQVEIHLSGISEKFSYALSKLYHEYSEKDRLMGRKPSDTLTFLQPDYKASWNALAGEYDNSYREDKFIIVGSLLKTFSLGRANQISGQIIKYNTKDGKTRIGIEVANNTDFDNQRESTYTTLEKRYSTETAYQHPVYYDGNEANVNRFIADYIYHATFQEIYDRVKEGTPKGEEIVEIDTYNNRRFLFQISSVDRDVFLEVEMSDKMWEEYETMAGSFNDGELKKVKDFYDKDKFRKNLELRILAGSVADGDYFAYKLQKSTSKDITSENYTITTKSRNYPDVEPSRWSSKSGERYRLGGIKAFKHFFPTNIISIDQVTNYGFTHQASLKMSYADFLKMVALDEKNKTKETFATGSSYFDKFKNEYVFEQFSDEVESVTADVDKIYFKEDVNSGEKEVNAMIDELVSILTKI